MRTTQTAARNSAQTSARIGSRARRAVRRVCAALRDLALQHGPAHLQRRRGTHDSGARRGQAADYAVTLQHLQPAEPAPGPGEHLDEQVPRVDQVRARGRLPDRSAQLLGVAGPVGVGQRTAGVGGEGDVPPTVFTGEVACQHQDVGRASAQQRDLHDAVDQCRERLIQGVAAVRRAHERLRSAGMHVRAALRHFRRRSRGQAVYPRDHDAGAVLAQLQEPQREPRVDAIIQGQAGHQHVVPVAQGALGQRGPLLADDLSAGKVEAGRSWPLGDQFRMSWCGGFACGAERFRIMACARRL